MSFYFQPPIFAVQTPPATHSYIYIPTPALGGPTTAIQPQFPRWLHTYTTPAPAWPPLSSTLSTTQGIPGTVSVRLVFYGQGPRGLWYRATEATYLRESLPNRAGLKGDIGRWATQLGLSPKTWWARVMVMGGPGLVMLPETGPVLNMDVVMVELREGRNDDDDDAVEGQLGELLARVQDDQVVYVLVCMDEYDEAGTTTFVSADGQGEREEQDAAVREGGVAEAVRTEEEEQQDMTTRHAQHSMRTIG